MNPNFSSSTLEIALAPIGLEEDSASDRARLNPSRSPSARRDDPERRIEEWIVRSLDDEPAPGLDRVLDRMLSGSLGKRRARPGREVEAAGIGPEAAWSRFRVDRRNGIAIVTLLDASLVQESILDGLAAELDVLIASGSRRIVLNFAGVERLSSRFVLTILRASRKCSATPGGRLRASNLRPEIAPIAALIPSIEAFSNEEAAIASPWPGPAIFTPLPVSILSELTGAEAIGVDDRTLELEARREVGPYDVDLDELPIASKSAALIVLDGRAKGRSIPLVGERFLIGREPGCHLRLHSPSVSRVHASIEVANGRAVLRDLGSTNGSILNGTILRDRSASLRHGDRIEIDSARFVFSAGGGPRPFDLDARVLDWIGDTEAEPGAETIAEHEPGPFDGLKRLDLGEFSEVLRCELVEDVVILTPLIDELDDDSRVEPLRSALLELMNRRAPRRVVLNLGFVSKMSSHATGVLVAHHLRLLRSGGGLRCCLAQPLVASYLAQIRLPMLVDLYTSLEDAVLTAW